jgi:hypothetical protein
MRLLINFSVIVVVLIGLSTALQAKNKKVKTSAKAPQDEIEVVGHIPLTNGPVRRLLSTQHYSSYYLYVEYEASRSVTLIDVTKATRPVVLADVSYPSNGGNSSLFTVAGTAALVTEEPGSAAPALAVQTIRIMDFSDPLHPKVAREFTDGIWILHQSFAEDPAVDEAYAHHVLYDR